MDMGETHWGEARWDAGKAARWTLLHAGAIAGCATFHSWSAVSVFAVLTVLTMGPGVSVGIHRGLIHRAFRASRTVERWLGTLGVLAGLGGIIGMSRMHALRDFHQNQPEADCPPYFGYREGFTRAMADALLRTWHPRDASVYPPVDADLATDPWFRFLERAGLWLQVPLALVLYAVGGPAWVAWGVLLRLALTQDGFWFVHYVSHVEGERPYVMPGTAEEGRNAGWLALVSLGESWHNNHHAYPGSARMGFGWRQPDPGWWCVRVLATLGLVHDVKTPDTLPLRPGALAVTAPGQKAQPTESASRSRTDHCLIRLPRRLCGFSSPSVMARDSYFIQSWRASAPSPACTASPLPRMAVYPTRKVAPTPH
ncbi:acyl-CoA desaturase [Myxococcus sp. K15C18031901]|uniref:acyl-CoA desaturase n=1 Tax=Myxococcus dinghuensis TaxID=2906761 RepID=UPI0020A71C06|nr:acyl-CoA desaturase [Myxococcus dinghuensis]MCP3099062.1 acyl-CoA desaturase [Myxococcus dinghuensis]